MSTVLDTLMSTGRTKSWARHVVVLCFAASPVVAGAIGLCALRPPPAEAADDRTLIVTDTPTVPPGRPALSLAGLRAPLDFEHLPFDEVTTPSGDRLFSRARRWSLVDGWPDWEVWVQHGARPERRCSGRRLDGGWGCGRGVQLVCDVVALAGAYHAVARTSAVPDGDTLRFSTHAPAPAQGSLTLLSDASATLRWATGDAPAAMVTCRARCPLSVPAGRLTLTVVGPSGPLAIELWEER